MILIFFAVSCRYGLVILELMKEQFSMEFSVFISHVIITKNCNRPINKFKNLGHDMNQVSAVFHSLAIRLLFAEECHPKFILRVLYRDAMFVSFGGAQTWRAQRKKTSIVKFCS